MEVVEIVLVVLGLFNPLYSIYLPNVQSWRVKIGAQDETKRLQMLYPSGSIYHISARWDQIERVPGLYFWDMETDKAVKAAKEQGLLVVIGTRASPDWVRKYTDKTCSQPGERYYRAYGAFLAELLQRYKPWAVEVWNEPDIRPYLVPDDWWIAGCWDSGRYYADMLSVIYPMLKRADPGVIVLAGALMFTDDSWSSQWLNYSKDNFDMLSFHAYAYAGMRQDAIIQTKAQALRELSGGKPLLVTETALLSHTCTDDLDGAKADYLHGVARNAQDWGVSGWLWYPIGENEWMCSDLYPGAAYDAWVELGR